MNKWCLESDTADILVSLFRIVIQFETAVFVGVVVGNLCESLRHLFIRQGIVFRNQATLIQFKPDRADVVVERFCRTPIFISGCKLIRIVLDDLRCIRIFFRELRNQGSSLQVSVHLIGGLIKANWSGKFRLHSGSVSKCHATFLTSADSLSHVHRASCRRNKNLELALVIFNFSKWKFAATDSRLNSLAVSGIGDGLRIYKILFTLCANIFWQCGVVRIEFFEREVLRGCVPSWICSIEIGLDSLEFGIQIRFVRSKQHFLCSLIVCLNNSIGDSTIEC